MAPTRNGSPRRCRARPVSAYTWHHLILEFQRTSAGTSLFVSVTLDGRTSYFNRSFGTRTSSSNAVNVAFQTDGDYKQEPYSVWIDKMTLTYW